MKNFLKNLDPAIRSFLIIIPIVILVFVGLNFYRSAPNNSTADIYSHDSSRYDAKELGFSFQYSNSLFVSVDPDSPERLLILPQSLKTNKNEPITAIVISVAEYDPTEIASGWPESSDSGYDTSEDYGHRSVGGQDAIVVNDDWIIVKTPDGNREISIALLARNGAKPLLNELQEILDTFSFK